MVSAKSRVFWGIIIRVLTRVGPGDGEEYKGVWDDICFAITEPPRNRSVK